MRCPYCHDNDDKVIDSRATDGGKAIRRRRECNACGKRFTTYEHIEEQVRLAVIKKDGTRVPYDRQKMLLGLQKACYKRPVPLEQLSLVVDEVEDELFRRGEKEIPSLDIGRMLAERLKRIDPVAYLRFASVYMQFKDIDDLMAEAREVKASQQPPPAPDQGKLF
jgi:transcriptional repressor NrdR